MVQDIPVHGDVKLGVGIIVGLRVIDLDIYFLRACLLYTSDAADE